MKMAISKFQELLNSAVTTDPEELKNWIEKEINTKDENQQTVLHKASEAGNLPTVKYLIQIGAQIEAKDENEQTPLFKAVCENHFDVVKCLVENGAQIENQDNDGETPLFCARDQNIAKFLIDKGAQINFKITMDRLLFMLL